MSSCEYEWLPTYYSSLRRLNDTTARRVLQRTAMTYYQIHDVVLCLVAADRASAGFVKIIRSYLIIKHAHAHNATLYCTMYKLFVVRCLFAVHETDRCIPSRNTIPTRADVQAQTTLNRRRQSTTKLCRFCRRCSYHQGRYNMVTEDGHGSRLPFRERWQGWRDRR